MFILYCFKILDCVKLFDRKGSLFTDIPENIVDAVVKRGEFYV